MGQVLYGMHEATQSQNYCSIQDLDRYLQKEGKKRKVNDPRTGLHTGRSLHLIFSLIAVYCRDSEYSPSAQ